MIETCSGCLKRDNRGFIGSDLLKYLSSRSRINASFSEQRLVALATAVLTKRRSPSCDFLNLDRTLDRTLQYLRVVCFH